MTIYIMAGKAVLIGGSRDVIEGSSWPALFRAATGYGGPMPAFETGRSPARSAGSA